MATGSSKGELKGPLSSEKRPDTEHRLPGPVNADLVGTAPARRTLLDKLGKLAMLLNVIWLAVYFGKHFLPLDSLFGGSNPVPSFKNEFLFNGETVRSNGTHNYKRTVLLVSIDGLRFVGFTPSAVYLR